LDDDATIESGDLLDMIQADTQDDNESLLDSVLSNWEDLGSDIG